ncbi:MAG: DNA translocase FtsK 4TM domain-containing protein [Eubacteriales bacterium]
MAAKKDVKNNKSGVTGKAPVKSAATGKGGEKNAARPKGARTEKSFMRSAMPYILMVFSVILAICFFTVQLLEIDDGAGIVGYGIQWFFCGMFGGAAFLIPAVLMYIGVKWCLFNIKWSPKKASGCSDDTEQLEVDRVKDRRRLVLQTVMSGLIVLLFSVAIGVIGDNYASPDIADMWLDAADNLVGGGIIGSSVALLMITCFEQVISMIILCVLMFLAFIFMIGITPDWIVLKIQYNAKLRKEKRAAEHELLLREAAEKEAQERRHANRIASPSAVSDSEKTPRTEQKKSGGMSVDEMMNDAPQKDEDPDAPAQAPEAEPVLMPLDPASNVYIGPSDKSDDIYIGVTGKPEHISQPQAQHDGDRPEENVGKDFGGDPMFDSEEFSGIDSVIRNLKPENAASDGEKLQEPTLPIVESDELSGLEHGEKIDLGHIGNDELLSDVAAVAPDDTEAVVEIETPYVFPPIDLLEKNKNVVDTDYSQELQENAQKLMDTLKSFKVNIREITYSRGPTITRYELKPEAGTRVRAIANLVDDIALNLATTGVRIEAPIPNKPAVGIEVPNRNRATVYLRDLIDSPKFAEAKSRMTACLGMDVGGNPIYFDIGKMPHLLIAGATGMGKSVCINCIIVSLLYKAKPDELKLILIDPKKVEFNIYKNIPHLYAPIVSDPKKAAGALASAVAEMERRFELIEDVGVRDIATYNAVTENDPDREFMPHMVIIIDELADLMMTAPDEVESSICRLAQKARAAGIHIIIGTQRPSVDVITGLIKANIPSRIACTVASQVDSRTIIDIAGAEKLIGKGDMLFAPVGASKPMRVQGAFVSEAEVEKIVTFLKDNNASAKFNNDFISRLEEEAAKCGMGKKGNSGGFDAPAGDEASDGGDSKFREAVKLAIEEGKISTSLLQRRLGLGYGRAAKLIDEMEARGYVSKPDGNKPRRVLITMEEYMRRVVDNDLGDDAEE